MKSHEEEFKKYGKIDRKAWLRIGLYGILATIFFLNGSPAYGNLMIFFALFMVFHRLVLYKVIENFQNKAWPWFQAKYVSVLKWGLKRPYTLLMYTLGLFVFSIVLMAVRKPNIVFFPQGDPNNIFVYVKLPEGTDPAKNKCGDEDCRKESQCHH